MSVAVENNKKQAGPNDGSVRFPEPEGDLQRTTEQRLDEALEDLSARKDEWVSLPIDARIELLDSVMDGLNAVADDWIALNLKMKSLAAGTFSEAEEWGVLWAVYRNVRLMRKSLVEIRDNGRPIIPGPVRTRSDGQVVAPVFPQTRLEKILFRGVAGEVWMDPDISVDGVLSGQASPYSDEARPGAVTMVLGAGNAPFMPFAQSMYKLFVELRVVILKLNPVNAYMGPLFEHAFRALIRRGFMRFAYGGGEVGSYLTNHPRVDEIQLIGSDKTFEAIVFGTGAEQERRKADRDPVLTKPIDAELGNVSPVIVVPGPWKPEELAYQSARLASWMHFNSGFACFTPRVIIQHDGWFLREGLLSRLGKTLSTLQTEKAYYPGAEEAHASFLTDYPGAFEFGAPAEGELPWTLISHIEPTSRDEACFRSETFCTVLAETALEAKSVPEYLSKAVEFCNEVLWGTLSATIIIHPHTLKDPDVAEALEHAIADLRYGTICVNFHSGVALGLLVTPWQGYPTDDIYDIQSGNGAMNNVLMFERPQKAVIRGPFMSSPDPFLATSRRSHVFARKLARFDASPSVFKFPGLVLSAFRS